MNIFTYKKKLTELEKANEVLREDNQELLKQISDLKAVIKNQGYKIPETKHLIFKHDNHWLVQCHFNSVINSMNANDIEIIDNKISNNDFDIYYRLPPTLKSADFSFQCNLDQGTFGSYTYETRFTFIKKI